MTGAKDHEIAALHDEIRRLNVEILNAHRIVWWIARAQPKHRINVYPTMHGDDQMELVRDELLAENGWRYTAAVVYRSDRGMNPITSLPTSSETTE